MADPEPEPTFDRVLEMAADIDEDETLGWPERMDRLFALYARHPSLTVLLRFDAAYDRLDAACRERLWCEYRRLLVSNDPRIVEPVQDAIVYLLETREDAWDALTRPPLDGRLLAGILGVSGIVPWDMKAGLFLQALEDPALHRSILGGLACCVHGFAEDRPRLLNVDAMAAANILARLDLPPETPNLAEVRAAVEARAANLRAIIESSRRPPG